MEGDFQDEGHSIPSSAIMGGSEGSSRMSSASMHGAFSDEGDSAMSWKQDTPPKVFYQAHQTFAQFAKPEKRPFAQAFANDEQVEHARETSGHIYSQPLHFNTTHRPSLLSKRPPPQAFFSNTTHGPSSISTSRLLQRTYKQPHPQAFNSNITHGTSSISSSRLQQRTHQQSHPQALNSNITHGPSSISNSRLLQRTYQQSHPPALYSNITHGPSSHSNSLLQQQIHEQERQPDTMGYLSRVCGSIGNLVVRVATHPINRASLKALHSVVRWAASKNRHTETTYIAVVQLADGAKRRIVGREEEIATVNQGDIQLERGRRRIASQRQNEQNRLRAQAQQRALNRSRNEFHPTPAPDYFMSGALMDTEDSPLSTPTPTQRMPGSWEESPVNDASTYYNHVTPITVTPITHKDLDVYDHVVDVRDTERVEPSQAAPASNAWPYFGNEYNQVQLEAVDNDDGDPSMTSGDALDESSVTDSTDSEETSSTDSPPDSAYNNMLDIEPEDKNMLDHEPVDHDMLDNEPVEVESNTSDEDSYEVMDGPSAPVIPSAPIDPLALQYSWDNRNPDAVQRAAADEFNEIIDDETIISDDPMDHDNPDTASAGFPSTAHEAPINPATPIQSTGLDKGVGSEASPSSSSFLPDGIESPQGLGSSHHGLSPKDSPAVFDQGTPGQGASSSLQESPVVHQTPSLAPITPSSLKVLTNQSPQKRVTFYQSPVTCRPVDKYKNYIKGESMDYCDASAITEDDSSILSELTSTPELHSSPCLQELLAKQLMVEEEDQQSFKPPSPEVAPVEAVPDSPVTPASLSPALQKIKKGRVSRQRNNTRLAVSSRGSPLLQRFGMQLRSAGSAVPNLLTASSVNKAPVNAKESVNGKETVNIGSSSPDGAVTSILAQGGLAHREDMSPHNTSSPSNLSISDATAIIESPSRASLAHGNPSSSTNEDIFSSAQDGAPNAPDSSSPTSSHGESIDASNSSSNEPSPSNEPSALISSPSDFPHIASQTANAGDASVEIALDNGTVDTPVKEAVSPSTQAATSAFTNTPQPALAEDALDNGTVDTPAKEAVSPSTQAATSAVTNTPQPALAEGTLVHGQSSSLTENGSSTPSNQVDASTYEDPSPATLARQFTGLGVSGRRDGDHTSTKTRKESQRQAAREAKRVAKEKKEAEEKARKAKEAAEERKKRGTRRMPVQRVIQPLSAEWDTKVDSAMREPLSKKIASTLTGTEITRRDLGKVLPQPNGPREDANGWLNDTIISAYLELVVDYALKVSGHKRGDFPKFVALSTYFYPKLKSDGVAAVTRWLKRVKIEGKQMKNVERIFMPVNCNNNHWTLLVISPKFKTIEYFDSMHGPSAQMLGNAKKMVEHNLGDEFVEREWKVVNVQGPTQLNGSDCGVFVNTTAKMIALGVDPMAVNGNDMPVQRRRIVAEIINGGFDGELAPGVVFADD